jgi:hypothetical protein
MAIVLAVLGFLLLTAAVVCGFLAGRHFRRASLLVSSIDRDRV